MLDYYNSKLYENRETVGKELKEIMKKQRISGKKLCEQTGINGADLKKVLGGTIKNEEVFCRIINTFMQELELSPVDLLGEVVPNEIRKIREWEGVEMSELAADINMDVKRLEEIENGVQATLAELRDIAFVLAVGTSDLLGDNVLPTQVHKYCLCFDNMENRHICSFWGHVGILLEGEERYHWYPVSTVIKDILNAALEDESIVGVPTMNNKALLINMKKVTNIVFTSFIDGPPYGQDMAAGVSASELDGETPLVIYESLPEYEASLDEDGGTGYEASEAFTKLLDAYRMFSGKYIQENVVFYYGHMSKVYDMEFLDDETLSRDVERAFSGVLDESDTYFFSDYNGNFITGKFGKVAMIEMPLTEVIKGLSREYDEDFLESLEY